MALLSGYQQEEVLAFLAWFVVLTVAAIDVIWCQVRSWRRYSWPAWARVRR